MEQLEAHLRAHPDDRAVWTVYGDWLLEHGDLRGELVRSGREPTTAELDAWRGPIPVGAASAWQHGFVTELELSLDKRCPALLAATFVDPAGRLVSSVVIRSQHLRLMYGDDDPPELEFFDSLAPLLAVDLRRLRALAIRHRELTDVDIDALVAAQLAITELDLRYTGLTDQRLARIMDAPWAGGLRRLRLQRNPLTDGAPLVGRALESLDIRDTAIDASALRPTVATLIAHGEVNTGERRSAPPAPKLVEGLTISPRPTDRFTAVRYIDKRSLSRTITKDCARVAALPGFVEVYVDPHEYSFRTFENILPLDRSCPGVDISLADHVELAHEVHRFTLQGELPAFDELPLYTQPVNAASRGGQRYIFHAAPLADALTHAVRTALPGLRGFSHVNPVFRCNRFEPGDEPFHRHLDTPYHDAARDHISKYTLLVYLTGGTGAPALQIESLAIDKIDARQCFVFHQAYEHSGAAYTDGRKVFLRTELVFETTDVANNPRIAALFSKACYLTGESVRDAELARDADRAYNAVAAAHWRGALPPFTEPFVHKQFHGVHWLANGYDFWFPKALPLADCAALTLLDYFNCQLAGQPFRTLATSEVVREADPDTFLAGQPAPPPLPILDKAGLILPLEDDGTCCPEHAGPQWFDPSRSYEVQDLYRRAQTFARTRIEPAPIVMLGERVFLDPSRFVVDGNQLHVLSTQRLAPVNFAACWNCHSSPPNFVDVDVHVRVMQPLVPPILWETTRETHHLMFDFFRNGWAVTPPEQADVPVPRIRFVDPETVDESEMPWLEASPTCRVDPGLPNVHGPFWAHGQVAGGLMRELYADKPKR